MKVRIATILILICIFCGCSINRQHSTDANNVEYLNSAQTSPNEAPIENTKGSLWISLESGRIFSDHNSWRVGDILTVIISETAKASKSADTTTSRETGLSGNVTGFLSPKIMDNVLGPNPSNLLGMSYKNSHEGKGITNRAETLEARIGVIVKKILIGGNLYVEGNREITVNDEKQIIEIKGIVRTRDIKRNNTILSSFLANASIKYYGKGVISERQKPGWLGRILDWVRPI